MLKEEIVRDRAKIIVWKEKKFLGLLSTSYFAIRYDDTFYISVGIDGIPKKVKLSVIEDKITNTVILKSNSFRVAKGKRFLEKTIFDNRAVDMSRFVQIYTKIVRDPNE